MRDYIVRIRGFGRDIKLFLLYSFFANIGFGAYILIYNLYLYALDYREDFIGVVSAIQTLMMAATSIMLGMLLRRWGTWRCITGGFGIFLVASYGLALVSWAPLLLLLAAMSGVGLAFLFTATMPFIIEWARRDQRPDAAAVAFSLISLAGTLGALIGGFAPALISQVIPAVETGTVGAFRGALLLGMLLGTLGLIPPFRMREARRGAPAEETAAPSGVDDTPEFARRSRRDMLVFVLVGGLMSLGFGMVIPFYNVFLTTVGASARQIGFVYALAGLSAAIIGLFAPAIMRRIGALRALLILRLAVVPVYLLLILMPGYWLGVVAHVVRQVSVSMAWPIDSTFIAEVLPPRARASVFGWRSGAWNLGMSTASLLGGVVIVQTGYTISFLSLAFFSTLAVAVFYVYFSRHPLIRAGKVPSASPRLEAPLPVPPPPQPSPARPEGQPVAPTPQAAGVVDAAAPAVRERPQS